MTDDFRWHSKDLTDDTQISVLSVSVDMGGLSPIRGTKNLACVTGTTLEILGIDATKPTQWGTVQHTLTDHDELCAFAESLVRMRHDN